MVSIIDSNLLMNWWKTALDKFDNMINFINDELKY